MKNRVLVGLCTALLVAAALPAAASTFVALDQEELVASSRAVVQGRVLDTRSFWNDDRTAIVSEARVEVTDLVAGEAPGVVVVRTFGGEVGNYRVEAHGFPSFSAGDRVLLFLETDGDSYRVAGYSQGHWRVRSTAKGEVAVPTLEEGVRLFTKDGRLAARPQPVQLDDFKNGIRERRNLIDDRRSVR
jgi:hypothetical protein